MTRRLIEPVSLVPATVPPPALPETARLAPRAAAALDNNPRVLHFVRCQGLFRDIVDKGAAAAAAAAAAADAAAAASRRPSGRGPAEPLRPPAPPLPLPLELAFAHNCRFLGCHSMGCDMCRHNPRKMCLRSFPRRFWAGDSVSAACTATLAVQVVVHPSASPEAAAAAAAVVHGAFVELTVVDSGAFGRFRDLREHRLRPGKRARAAAAAALRGVGGELASVDDGDYCRLSALLGGGAGGGGGGYAGGLSDCGSESFYSSTDDDEGVDDGEAGDSSDEEHNGDGNAMMMVSAAATAAAGTGAAPSLTPSFAAASAAPPLAAAAAAAAGGFEQPHVPTPSSPFPALGILSVAASAPPATSASSMAVLAAAMASEGKRTPLASMPIVDMVLPESAAIESLAASRRKDKEKKSGRGGRGTGRSSSNKKKKNKNAAAEDDDDKSQATLRLVARLVHADGSRIPGGRPAVSEPFAVVSRRTKNLQKRDYPSLDDCVTTIEHVGRGTVRRLSELAAAVRAREQLLQLKQGDDDDDDNEGAPSPPARAVARLLPAGLRTFSTVRDLIGLARAASRSPRLCRELAPFLGLSDSKLVAMTRHAGRAVRSDDRLRAWFSPGLSEALLYSCGEGSVRPDLPIAVMRLRPDHGSPEALLAARRVEQGLFPRVPPVDESEPGALLEERRGQRGPGRLRRLRRLWRLRRRTPAGRWRAPRAVPWAGRLRAVPRAGPEQGATPGPRSCVQPRDRLVVVAGPPGVEGVFDGREIREWGGVFSPFSPFFLFPWQKNLSATSPFPPTSPLLLLFPSSTTTTATATPLLCLLSLSL